MLVRLEVSSNKSKVKRVTLRSDAVIGRGADCNLRIASTEVSRRHCKISVSESAVQLRDLGSSNGTFLNGEALPPNKDVPISSGAQIAIGPIRFIARFEIPPGSDNAPGSTVEIPVVGAGQTAEEALQPADNGNSEKSPPVQGAVASAIAAAAAADVQPGERAPPGGGSDEAQDGAAESTPPGEIALPVPPHQTPDSGGDEETVDFELGDAEAEDGRTPVTTGPIPSQENPSPPAEQAESSTEQPEERDTALFETPADHTDAESEAAELSDFDFDEAPQAAGDFDFQEPETDEPGGQAPPEEWSDEQAEPEDTETEYEEEYEDDEAEAELDETPSKKGKLRSMFGLFRRKRAAADDAVADVEEYEEEGEAAEYEEEDPSDDEEYEEETEVEEAAPEAADSAEEIAQDDEPAQTEAEVSEDDVAGFLSEVEEEDADSRKAGDDELGDFLSQFGDS